MRVGDAVVILDCGAVTHSEFLTTPRPCEAMVRSDGSMVELARRTGIEQVVAHWA